MAHNISVAQLSSLIDFLEAHPDLALGRCIRTKEGRSLAKRLWAECAGTLNSISADCAQKSADQWRVYYNEYKSKLLKKIKLEKVEKNATGGGQAASIDLTPLQERLYSILGRDVEQTEKTKMKGNKKKKNIKEKENVPVPEQSMEKMQADAMLVLSESINRLAVAVELLAHRVPSAAASVPAALPPTRRHRCNISEEHTERLFVTATRSSSGSPEPPAKRRGRRNISEEHTERPFVTATRSSSGSPEPPARRRGRRSISEEHTERLFVTATRSSSGSPEPPAKRRRRRNISEEHTERPFVTANRSSLGSLQPPAKRRGRRNISEEHTERPFVTATRSSLGSQQPPAKRRRRRNISEESPTYRESICHCY